MQSLGILRAVVFDFDGVIVDTETPLYEAWARTFEHYGADPIGLDRWAESLGRHDDDPAMLDPMRLLRSLVGSGIDVDEAHRMRRRFRDEALSQMPIQPGVEALLGEIEALDLGVAIASSSPPDWIDDHLSARAMSGRFETVCCAGNGIAGKPAPAVYLEAATRLRVDPVHCLAIEDSPNGIAAAKAAGMKCVAVLTPINATLDLSAADARVDGVGDIDLADWH